MEAIQAKREFARQEDERRRKAMAAQELAQKSQEEAQKALIAEAVAKGIAAALAAAAK
jgi:hypothetical protein